MVLRWLLMRESMQKRSRRACLPQLFAARCLVMGNTLTAKSNADAVAIDSSVVPAPLKPGCKPVSAADCGSAVEAGIAGADEQRSDIPLAPEQVWQALGEEGRAFVDKCLDVHTHCLGIGTNDSGCYIN